MDDLLEEPDEDIEGLPSTVELVGGMMMIVDEDERCACRCGCLRSRTSGEVRCADCVEGLHAG
ncbi:MAG: hypothetical protein M3N29_05940 [Chloroflexota bacterium]|nr:hypothetical protein [Chloroflexota bacterium]